MVPFERKDPTIIELLKWKRNESKNPRTNRTIKKTGNIFKLLKKNYNKYFSKNYDYLDSIDNKDPVSLNKFWIIKNNKKVFIHENYENLVLYKDSNNFIRCIEKDSLELLKAYNIIHHPVTFDKIPDEILSRTKDILLDDKLNVKQLALKVFKVFENISVYIDYNKFINLKKDDLIKFNYEIRDFYYQNISKENRIIIDKNDGKQFLTKINSDFTNLEDNEIKIYLLKEIDKLLSCEEESIKYMLNYIIIGALSLVVPEIKNQYPDFCFSF